MFEEYRDLCDTGKLSTGTLHLWRGKDAWVLNFPTKTTWRKPSEIQYVESGLIKFCESYEEMGISSISFPPLGCGNGNLDWRKVKPLMENYLSPLPIRVFIHDRQVRPDFVPEHLEGIAYHIPSSFDMFHEDLKTILTRNQGYFQTLRDGREFTVSSSEDADLRVMRDGKSERIPFEELENAWTVLQSGVLSADHYSGETTRRIKSYLFAILANLPYVNVAEIRTVRKSQTVTGHGLYFERDRSEFEEFLENSPKQKELWPSQQNAPSNM